MVSPKDPHQRKKASMDDMLSGEALLRSPKFKKYRTYLSIIIVVAGMAWVAYKQVDRIKDIDARIEESHQDSLEHSRQMQEAIQDHINTQLREQGIEVKN